MVVKKKLFYAPPHQPGHAVRPACATVAINTIARKLVRNGLARYKATAFEVPSLSMRKM